MNSFAVEKPTEIPLCDNAGGIILQTIKFLLYSIWEQN